MAFLEEVASQEAAVFPEAVAVLVASAVGARAEQGRAASEVSEVAFPVEVALVASVEATKAGVDSAAETKGVVGSAVATIVAGDADQL